MRTFHLMAGRTCVVTVSARSLKFLDCDHGKACHDLDGFVIPKNKIIMLLDLLLMNINAVAKAQRLLIVQTMVQRNSMNEKKQEACPRQISVPLEPSKQSPWSKQCLTVPSFKRKFLGDLA